MRRIIFKVKSKLSSDENGRSSDAQSGQEPTQLPADDGPLMQPPTALDVLRHRYQFGVNLGGGFVLEKSTSPGLYEPGEEGKSDGCSFRERSKEGSVVGPAEQSIPFDEVRARMQEADSERKGLKMRDVMAHTAYWSTRGEGWGWGWDDARAFWGMRACGNTEGATVGEVDLEGVELGGQSVEGQKVGGDFIGAMEVWVGKRLEEWLAERGMGKTAMSETEEVRMREWEQGFRDGVMAFEGVVRRPSWGKGRRFGGDGEESVEGEEGEEGEGRLGEVHGGEQGNGGTWTE